jgi:uncharacterized protein (TIGR02145 family)
VSEGPVPVDARGSNPNYDTAYFHYTLVVTPRDVTLKSGDSTKVYDGTALTCDSVTVGGSGFVAGEGFAITVTGSQTDVGSSPNTFTYTPNTGTQASDYTITPVTGTLTVFLSGAITLHCPSGADTTKHYDGIALQPTATAMTSISTDTVKVEYSIDGGHSWNMTVPAITHVDESPLAVQVRGSHPSYDTVYCNYTLNVTCREVTLTSGESSKVFDGTELRNETVTVSGDGWIAGKEATYDGFLGITNVDTIENIFNYHLATGEVASDYCVTVNYDSLMITPAPLSISIDIEKEYDGLPFVIDYTNPSLIVTGLVSGDMLTAGEITTSNYTIGTYVFRSVSTRGPVVSITIPFATAKDIKNYEVSLFLKLGIKPHVLALTAADTTKVYDGTAVTSTKYAITGGSIVSGDTIISITQGGSQTCVGSSAHTISDAVIMKDGITDVTDQYAIAYVEGTLKVTPFTDFTCPTDEVVTLAFGACDTAYTPVSMPIVGPGLSAGSYTITSSITGPLGVGLHVITWTLKDACDNVMTSCTQNVTVKYPDCPDAVDYEGNIYHSVRIDCECWTQRNLESRIYSDGSAIPGFYIYNSTDYSDTIENLNRYGRLYDWPSTIKDSVINSYGHVQGVCPAGWYVPTAEQYASLNAHGANALKSNLYWLDGGGSNTTGFTSLPGGYYDGSIPRFMDLRGNAYYWSTTVVSGAVVPYAYMMIFDCEVLLGTDTRTGLAYSVRCIKEKD